MIKHVTNLVPDRGFVLWLDSDAIFFDRSLDFASFLQQVDFERDGKRVELAEAVRLRSEAPFFAFKNTPWEGVCTGVQAWRLPLSEKLLSQWWVTDSSTDRSGPFEQAAFNQLYPAWKDDVGVFDVTAFPTKLISNGARFDFSSFETQYIRHFCKDEDTMLRLAARIISTELSTTLQELKANHSLILSNEEMQSTAQALEGSSTRV